MICIEKTIDKEYRVLLGNKSVICETLGEAIAEIINEYIKGNI